MLSHSVPKIILVRFIFTVSILYEHGLLVHGVGHAARQKKLFG